MASSQLPKTMKGVIIEKTGGTEVLQWKEDLPVPEPKEGEVLVKNEYIGINYIDTYFRTGLYPAPNFPYILGREGAGTIASLGSSTSSDLSPGARVVYLGQGMYAEYSTVLASQAVPIPDAIPNKDAAAAFLQGLTALTLIREAYEVKKGDWILVTAAAGGVGLWLCQLLRSVGARTIAVASTEEKRKLAKDNGAEVTLEYHEDDQKSFVEKVKEITGGNGVAAAFDSVGKATFDAVLECVARKGTFASFGNASGAVPPISISRLSAKNAKLLRPTLFNYIATREELLKYSNELWDLIVKDGLNVKIHKVYPLKDVATAHKDIESRGTTGKLVLQI